MTSTRSSMFAVVVVAFALAACEGRDSIGQTDGGGDGVGNDVSEDASPWARHVGNPCNLRVDAGPQRAVINPMALECESEICLKPAEDPELATTPDTRATCSAECEDDHDCLDQELRGAQAGDFRCQAGFVCGVATETGLLCCKKLCLCRDFLVIPKGGLQEPTACDPGNAVNLCQNLPGRG